MGIGYQSSVYTPNQGFEFFDTPPSGSKTIVKMHELSLPFLDKQGNIAYHQRQIYLPLLLLDPKPLVLLGKVA